MKNLIIALSLFFALGVNAQAKKAAPQKAVTKTAAVTKTTVVEKKLSNEEMAKKNTADLNAFTPLQPDMKSILTELFTTKYRMLNEGGELSTERKETVARIIGRKLEATLDPATFEKVKNNTVLFQKLTN